MAIKIKIRKKKSFFISQFSLFTSGINLFLFTCNTQIHNESKCIQQILSYFFIIYLNFAKQITWSFTPRGSNIPIPLTDFTNELKYVNASIDKHDGVYNCSTPSGDYQVKFLSHTDFKYT